MRRAEYQFKGKVYPSGPRDRWLRPGASHRPTEVTDQSAVDLDRYAGAVSRQVSGDASMHGSPDARDGAGAFLLPSLPLGGQAT
jgi:hypothetical protein